MAEAVSALDGRVAEGETRVADRGLCAMVSLRADLADAAVARAVDAVVGTAVPGPCGVAAAGARTVLWMSPDELLILLAYAEAAEAAAALDRALDGTHRLVAEVSDARALLGVEGPGAREVLAKLSPADLAPRAFGAGEVRRTRLGQAAAAIWMPAPDAFDVLCFRTVADYVFAALAEAARRDAAVGHF